MILDGDSVVLVKRAHAPLKGQWSLPGGGVELGETLDAALTREVLEETGLTIVIGPVIEVFDRIERDADGRIEFHYVIADYLCRCAGGRQPAAGSDADDVRWVDAVDLPAYELTDKAILVIRKARELAAAGF